MGNSLLLGFLLVLKIMKPQSEYVSVVQDENEITAMWKFRMSRCRARMRGAATTGVGNILSNMQLDSCGQIPKKIVRFRLPHIWNRLACSKALTGLSTKNRLYFISSLESLWGFITFLLIRVVIKNMGLGHSILQWTRKQYVSIHQGDSRKGWLTKLVIS